MIFSAQTHHTNTQVILPIPNIVEFKVQKLSGDGIGLIGWSGHDRVNPYWVDSHETWEKSLETHGIFSMGVYTFNGLFYYYDGTKPYKKKFKKSQAGSKRTTKYHFRIDKEILTVTRNETKAVWAVNKHTYNHDISSYDYDLYPALSLDENSFGSINRIKIFDIKFKDDC